MAWFIIVFLVLLKIPIVWLAYVIWWALKKQPGLEPGSGGGGGGQAAPDGPVSPPAPWWRPRTRRTSGRGGQRQAPVRRPTATPAPARAGQTTTTTS